MAIPAAAAVARLRSRHRPGPLSGPPGPGPRVPRASRGGFVASSATGAIVSATVALSDLSLLSVGGVFRTRLLCCLDCATAPPVVGLTDTRRVEWWIASLHGRPAPTRRARFRTRGAAGRVASR